MTSAAHDEPPPEEAAEPHRPARVAEKAFAPVAPGAPGESHSNKLVVMSYWVRLFDPFKKLMPRAPYRVTMRDLTWEGEADDEGWLELSRVGTEERCLLQWGRPDPQEEAGDEVGCHPDPDSVLRDLDIAAMLKGGPAPQWEDSNQILLDAAGQIDAAPDQDGPPDEDDSERAPAPADPSAYAYEVELYLDLCEKDEDEAARRRLHNLGFAFYPGMEENLQSLAWAYDETGKKSTGDVKSDVCKWHDDCDHRQWSQRFA